MNGVIDYQDVCFSYTENETVLDHINIHIDAGRSIAWSAPAAVERRRSVRCRGFMM